MQPPKPPPPSPDIDWSAHLTALAKSGLSVLEYARAHGLKADTLYKKRYRVQKQVARSPRLLPVTVEAAAPCELAFPDGRVLRFPASLAPDALRAFVLAVSLR
jgi:hypothetical protein